MPIEEILDPPNFQIFGKLSMKAHFDWDTSKQEFSNFVVKFGSLTAEPVQEESLSFLINLARAQAVF